MGEKDSSRPTVWVCMACGKRSRDKTGDNAIDYGWDVSCYMNSYECYEDSLTIEGGRVTKVDDGGVLEDRIRKEDINEQP